MNKIYNKDLVNARIIFYVVLAIEYIYLAYFSHFTCPGCAFCGMTRAVKSLLVLDFKSAFQFNRNVWIFCILIPIIIIDILIILKRRCLKNEK